MGSERVYRRRLCVTISILVVVSGGVTYWLNPFHQAGWNRFNVSANAVTITMLLFTLAAPFAWRWLDYGDE